MVWSYRKNKHGTQGTVEVLMGLKRGFLKKSCSLMFFFVKKRKNVLYPTAHRGQCPLWPMTVAHDHGYCYLQTKDVSGAAFEGASDGAVACNNRHHRVRENRINRAKFGKFSIFWFFVFGKKWMPIFFKKNFIAPCASRWRL